MNGLKKNLTYFLKTMKINTKKIKIGTCFTVLSFGMIVILIPNKFCSLFDNNEMILENGRSLKGPEEGGN